MNTEPPAADPPLLTNEVARVLNVTPETVRSYERVGRLRAVKTASGLRLFDRRDVERLAQQRRENGGVRR